MNCDCHCHCHCTLTNAQNLHTPATLTVPRFSSLLSPYRCPEHDTLFLFSVWPWTWSMEIFWQRQCVGRDRDDGQYCEFRVRSKDTLFLSSFVELFVCLMGGCCCCGDGQWIQSMCCVFGHFKKWNYEKNVITFCGNWQLELDFLPKALSSSWFRTFNKFPLATVLLLLLPLLLDQNISFMEWFQ